MEEKVRAASVGDIVIYESPDSSVSLEVRTDPETVWLNRHQIAELFGRDVKTIGKHINNAIKEELCDFPVVAKFATTAADGKTYQVAHYSLDVILSVGYRVKSSEGIQFRHWANTVLKQYFITGAAINEKRLVEIGKVVNILNRSSDDMISGVADVLGQYSESLRLLESYDEQSLKAPKGTDDIRQLEYQEARELIDSMPYFLESDLFGREKDDSFKSALAGIYQSFDGEELYPSVQEKAANLLYMIIKNHPFNDGNKRIGATMFVYFLSLNGALTDELDRPLIANNALAAITLMIALSKPDEKDMMCLLVMNMLKNEALANG